MIANEHELAAQIDAWDPEQGDLPDALALAIDESDVLRARFDARFARWAQAEETPVPETLEARVMPPPRRQASRVWWVVVPSLLAAAALLVVLPTTAMLTVGSAPMSPAKQEVSSVTSALVPIVDAPIAGADLVSDLRGDEGERRIAGNKDEKAQLELLGYMTPDVTIDGKEKAGKFAADGWYRTPTDPLSVVDGFVDHGVNGWKIAKGEPLSTFSIDVDRGSYTFARRRLTEGFLPDPSAVRVEEFVNALVYDYPEPDDGPFTVQFEASPSPWNDARHLVRIGVQGRHVTERAPVHLTFLVDTSGSMSGADRLPLVKQALQLLVGELEDGDTVAIVTYAGSAGVALPPTPATDQKRILSALDRLESGGSTAMGEGIALAYALADDARRPGHTNRVIIASDGDANVGTTRTGTLSELIRGYADQGVTLTTLGFGEGNYQDDRMEQLANDGDGNYYYVDGPAEARRVFVDELTSTLEVIAKDVKIQVDWNPDAVSRYRLIGYENRALANRDFRDDAIDAGEIGAGHTVTALYAVELVPGKADPIATVRLRAKAPGAESPSTERTFTLPRGAIQPSFEASSADHRMAVATAAFAERLRQSPYTAGVGYRSIEAIARSAARPDHPQDVELVGLVHRAVTLSGDDEKLCNGVPCE